MSNSPANAEKPKRGRGRPFVAGQTPPGPGRPAVPPEVRAARRRVIADLAAELKTAADIACDTLVEIASNEKAKHSDRIAAASQILDRSFGRAPASLDATISFSNGDRLTPEMLRSAALRVAGAHAEDVFA
jgi:hypothetical protein